MEYNPHLLHAMNMEISDNHFKETQNNTSLDTSRELFDMYKRLYFYEWEAKQDYEPYEDWVNQQQYLTSQEDKYLNAPDVIKRLMVSCMRNEMMYERPEVRQRILVIELEQREQENEWQDEYHDDFQDELQDELLDVLHDEFHDIWLEDLQDGLQDELLDVLHDEFHDIWLEDLQDGLQDGLQDDLYRVVCDIFVKQAKVGNEVGS